MIVYWAHAFYVFGIRSARSHRRTSSREKYTFSKKKDREILSLVIILFNGFACFSHRFDSARVNNNKTSIESKQTDVHIAMMIGIWIIFFFTLPSVSNQIQHNNLNSMGTQSRSSIFFPLSHFILFLSVCFVSWKIDRMWVKSRREKIRAKNQWFRLH